jgi:hypothetical protein
VVNPQPLDEPAPQPTAGDIENAERRREIAEAQFAEYSYCMRLALGALGLGWTPWMKLVLLESDYHQNRDRPPVVGGVVYKVYRGELKLSENSVYLMERPDGTVRKADRYEQLFGALLDEPHPTRTLEIRGEHVPAPRWSVCWSALDLYEPRTAEELAALRVSREQGRVQRETKEWAEAHPLFVWAGLGRNDDTSA